MGGLHQIRESRQVAANSKSGTEGANIFQNEQHATEGGKSVAINRRLAQQSHILVDMLPTTPGTSKS